MASKGLGSCYFAERPEGCFLEVFKSYTEVIPREELEARLIVSIQLPRAMIVADCTSPRARVWGITAEIHSTPRYDETHAWAHAFAQTGFEGVRYLHSATIRHNVSPEWSFSARPACLRSFPPIQANPLGR